MSFLIDRSLRDVWYHLLEIRKIDRELRREEVFRFANKIVANHGRHFPFSLPKDNVD
jgi:hypothetical protein